MNIFNSLGSNYTKSLGVYRLHSSSRAPSQLKSFLKQHYQAEAVEVTYKGREAITLALQQLDLPAESQIAVCGYTCYAVYQAVVAAGLEPVYIDIEKDQLNFTAQQLESVIRSTPNLRAVMIQNTLGMPADIEAIAALCKQHKLELVEDLAHSIGLVYSSGKEAGTIGITALSFSQDKMIDAVSGGAVVSQRALRVQPELKPASLKHRFTTRLYPWATWLIRSTIRIQIGRVILKLMKTLTLLPGPMSGQAAPAHRLPAWHSQIALHSFKQLPERIAHRQEIAAVYRKWLPSTIQFQHTDTAIYLRFPIVVERPKDLIAHLSSKGIYLSDRWYDAPISPKKSLSLTNYKAGQCPNAEYVAARMVNLPTHVHVTKQQARQIAEYINSWLEKHA